VFVLVQAGVVLFILLDQNTPFLDHLAVFVSYNIRIFKYEQNLIHKVFQKLLNIVFQLNLKHAKCRIYFAWSQHCSAVMK